ncbi:MAG: LicD family protein [Eubacterium sp.]|nr:LicD family protein [Eubacterium sp.]
MEQFSELKPAIQKRHVELLKKFNEICDKYKIKYWAFDGTLLGTIRHKGFIPWDDDLDLAMMREDFEKLRRVPAEEWGEDYKLIAPGDDDKEEIHDRLFPRVYQIKSVVQSDKDVQYWRRWSDNEPWRTALMCDIFLFDYTPESEEEYLKKHKKCKKYRNLYKLVKLKPVSPDGSIKNRIKAFCKRSLSRFFRILWKKPWRTVEYWLKREAAKCDTKTTVGAYCTSDKIDIKTYPKADIFPLEKKPFEDTYTYVPKNWEQMLTDKYGDYMTPPPEDQRDHLSPSYVDLGDGVGHVFGNPLPGSLAEKALAK